MSQSRNDQLREEIARLKFRLKTARDKEIILLSKLIEMQKRIDVFTADPVINRATNSDGA